MLRIFSRYLLQEVGFWVLVLTGVVLLVLAGGNDLPLLTAAGAGDTAPGVGGGPGRLTLTRETAPALPIGC